MYPVNNYHKENIRNLKDRILLASQEIKFFEYNGYKEVVQPRQREIITVRILILLGITALMGLAYWLYNYTTRGFLPLFLLALISIAYKTLKIGFEWYHYWSVSTIPKPAIKKQWKVDMFTTAMPGEPLQMVENTLRAMVLVTYPHTTYLCDEGDDPCLRAICEQLGVIHVTRCNRIDAKAGNINNALKTASGEICVILDPDHEPLPMFLDEVLPYFEDSRIGFVQIVQAYKNINDTWVARASAQHTYTFYGPFMMGMNRYGTVQAIGANCTFRRKALDSIGGHAPGLSEDMHTAMQLHAKGWKSVYAPKILSRGLVPSTIDAYYKQQLKWSRGTFDLLFNIYPKLFTKFSWRQKLHYFLVPLHFAAGLIALIDIIIPLIALIQSESPLKFNINEVYIAFLPLFVMIILIRQYAQRWLLEKHERGFHFTGGILLFGTWWVHLLGLIYTLINKKVPYIPTPKEDEQKNSLLISIPNILVALISIIALLYGLQNDWSPYSLIMAGFCLLNTFMLIVVCLAGQHEMGDKVESNLLNASVAGKVIKYLADAKRSAFIIVCYLLRNGTVPITILLSVLFFGFLISKNNRNDSSQPITTKEAGGFYFGIYNPEIQEKNSLQPIAESGKELKKYINITSIYVSWGPESIGNFPRPLLDNILESGSIPMITWEPWVSSFPQRSDHPELKKEKKAMSAIANGKFDDYIRLFALKIRDLKKPVFIRFAHEFDNPAYPWSMTGNNTPGEYIGAWRKIAAIFAASGVNNVAWVWNPWNPSTMNKYYPGDQYVDWIGLTSLNYGLAAHDKKWRSFEEIYNPYRSAILKKGKPIMLAEFGSTSYGGNAQKWILNAWEIINTRYPEIKSLVLFNSNKDKNWITQWRPTDSTRFIDWTDINLHELFARFNQSKIATPIWKKQMPDYIMQYGKNSKYSDKTTHSTALKVDGKPFYIKGIAYNPGHEWRDGYYPLTRRQLEKDFEAIKTMGCNTIRRYNPSIYDQNIFNVAEKKSLKIVYGFWFDPEVDYYRDTIKVKEYINQVIHVIKKHKDEHAILAWNIGNETSGLLKKYFEQPYLQTVRDAYMHMIETLAQTIRQIDPDHPVITTLEHSWQLPGELLAYHQKVPSVDFMGINSYYEEQLSTVNTLMAQFDSSRSYLITEFGPKGYWNADWTDLNKYNHLEEGTDLDKANLYVKEWHDYIEKNKGSNIGGIAYCWRDRYEGTNTWFGITDINGRKKQVYYALQKTWTNQLTATDSTQLFIVGPNFKLKRNATYDYTARCNNPDYKYYEWHVYTDNFHEVARQSSIGNVVTIKIPAKLGKYRLYVYVSNGKGNVITASKHLELYKGIFNEGL